MEVKIVLYRITRCGYYRGRGGVAAAYHLPEMLDNLHNWVHRGGLSLRETATYGPDPDNEILPTYCYDIVKNRQTQDFFFTSWNETFLQDNEIMAVRGSQPVGHARIVRTGIDPDTIPGFPSYFWFVGNTDILASITFDYKYTAQPQLEKYIKSYLHNWSTYVKGAVVAGGNVAEVDGYGSPDDDTEYDLNPGYKTELVKNPGKINYILQERHRIKKVIGSCVLSLENQVGLETYQNALNLIGLDLSDRDQHDLQFIYNIKYTPLEGELEHIISHWTNRQQNELLQDVGFVFQGESSKIYWLSKSIAKRTVEIDITPNEDGIFPANNLMRILSPRRNIIDGMLDEQQ